MGARKTSGMCVVKRERYQASTTLKPGWNAEARTENIFSGSNATGSVADQTQRNWLSIELDRDYAWLPAVRTMENWPASQP